MKRIVTIEYSWECEGLPYGIPMPLAEALEESAMERITFMLAEGYTSGELHDNVNMDIPGHVTPEDGWECHGWFGINTKCE